jgi:hypothetical protein
MPIEGNDDLGVVDGYQNGARHLWPEMQHASSRSGGTESFR